METDDLKIEVIDRIKKLHNIKANGYFTESGTDAFLLCLQGIGIKKGDEVILPISICEKMVHAVSKVDAIPIIVDVDKYMGISIKNLKKAITRRTKVIVFWYPYGKVIEVSWLSQLQMEYKYQFYIIEDCAQIAGIQNSTVKIGSIGDFSLFSFGKSKPIPAYGGGLLFVNNAICEDKIKKIYIQNNIEKNNYFKLKKLLLQIENVDSLMKEKKRKAFIYYSILKNVGIFINCPIRSDVNIYNRVILYIPTISDVEYDQVIEEVQRKVRSLEDFKGWDTLQETIDVNESIYIELNKYYLQVNRCDLIKTATEEYTTWNKYRKKYFYFRTNDFIPDKLVLKTCKIFLSVLKKIGCNYKKGEKGNE